MNKPLHIFPNPPADLDPARLDPRVPQHVAVIMDGNGRWAKKRGPNRLFGHKAGIEAVRETIRCASDVGVRYLTIYSFSSENWKRPAGRGHRPHEPVRHHDARRGGRPARGARARDDHRRTDELPKKTRDAFAKAWEKTKDNDGMTLGGGRELRRPRGDADAMRSHGRGPRRSERAERRDPRSISEELFDADCTRRHPRPRPAHPHDGEMRISNFLLWQIAYSEFVCTPCCGPTSTATSFYAACWSIRGATGGSGRWSNRSGGRRGDVPEGDEPHAQASGSRTTHWTRPPRS